MPSKENLIPPCFSPELIDPFEHQALAHDSTLDSRPTVVLVGASMSNSYCNSKEKLILPRFSPELIDPFEHQALAHNSTLDSFPTDVPVGSSMSKSYCNVATPVDLLLDKARHRDNPYRPWGDRHGFPVAPGKSCRVA